MTIRAVILQGDGAGYALPDCDVRFGSPTFGQHVSALISATKWNQILVPTGFAHGLLSLEPDTEVIYIVSNYSSPEHEAGFVWNDPALGIDWPAPRESRV